MRGHAKGEEAIGADDGIRTRDPHPGKGAWFVHVRPPVFIVAGERRGPSATADNGCGRTTVKPWRLVQPLVQIDQRAPALQH